MFLGARKLLLVPGKDSYEVHGDQWYEVGVGYYKNYYTFGFLSHGLSSSAPLIQFSSFESPGDKQPISIKVCREEVSNLNRVSQNLLLLATCEDKNKDM